MTDQLDRLLAAAADEGVVVTVNADGRVKLSGPSGQMGKWKAALAPHKPAILSRDLDSLIEAAARHYGYSAADLRMVRAIAASDPEGLRLALRSDPLRQFYQTENRPSPDRENPITHFSEQPPCY